MKNIVPCFTNDEIDTLYERCGFTDEESELFWFRRSQLSIEECAELMNISVRTASRINKRMTNKIRVISNLYF